MDVVVFGFLSALILSGTYFVFLSAKESLQAAKASFRSAAMFAGLALVIGMQTTSAAKFAWPIAQRWIAQDKSPRAAESTEREYQKALRHYTNAEYDAALIAARRVLDQSPDHEMAQAIQIHASEAKLRLAFQRK